MVFARNDGNLTRMEVLLGLGEMQGVLKVLVNDVEIPAGVAGTNMTGTGWYNVMTLGTRRACTIRLHGWNRTSGRRPVWQHGIPFVVVPNRLNDGSSLPRVKVLVQGLRLPMYGTDGTQQANSFEQPGVDPAGHPRRAGWAARRSTLRASPRGGILRRADCGIGHLRKCDHAAPIPVQPGSANRRSAGDLVRAIRNAARLLLTYGADGRCSLRVENTMAWSRPTSRNGRIARSLSTADGRATNSATGLTESRASCESPPASPASDVSRSMADTPNRLTVEFQDALNEYQQDSFSLVDPDDVARSGQEVAATLSGSGLPNYDQAARILKLNLDKSVRGNTYVEFETSVKAFGIRAGDLITVTYFKEGSTGKHSES